MMPEYKRPNAALLIFRKEFREIFRDRRTVMSVIIGPLLITPGLFWLIGMMAKKQAHTMQTATYTVGLVGRANAPNVASAMQATPGLKWADVTDAQAQTQIANRTLSAALFIPSDAQTRMETGQAMPLQILQDPSEQNSLAAGARLEATIADAGQKLVAKRLADNNLPTDFARPFQVTQQAIKNSAGSGSVFLSMMLPYILVLAAFSGAIYAAFDQVAGEKERGTLETLLVSPASRRDIVLGKFGAVVGVCLVSSILSVAGLVVAFNLKGSQLSALAESGLHLSATSMIVILLVMLPLSVLFAGMLLAVSTFARNQKEAQTYIGPLMLLVILPAMASMFVGSDAGLPIAFVPILGASVIIKQALRGGYDPTFIIAAFAASAVYAAFALAYATRLFQKESVLIKA